MYQTSSKVIALGSVILGAASAWATSPSIPAPSAAAVAAKTAANQPAQPASESDRQIQQLLERLTQLSEHINKNGQSPDLWRHQLSQGEVSLRLAGLAKDAKERDSWLRMAVDNYMSASIQGSEKDPTAAQHLTNLIGWMGKSYPGNPVISYAIRQEIQVDYMRMLSKAGDNPVKAQEHLRDRLLRFAQQYPNDAETPKVILEAGQVCEMMGKPDDARHCYRYLVNTFSGKPEGRKAGGALWRLGLQGEPMKLELPQLYANPTGTILLNIEELRGKHVLVYFWTSTSPKVEEGFEALKQLADRQRSRGLEIIYVNLDKDKETARTFLSGRLLSGIPVHQAGGLDSPIAERYGIQSLPQAFLVGVDGKVIKHSIPPGQLESIVSTHLPRGR